MTSPYRDAGGFVPQEVETLAAAPESTWAAIQRVAHEHMRTRGRPVTGAELGPAAYAGLMADMRSMRWFADQHWAAPSFKLMLPTGEVAVTFVQRLTGMRVTCCDMWCPSCGKLARLG